VRSWLVVLIVLVVAFALGSGAYLIGKKAGTREAGSSDQSTMIVRNPQGAGGSAHPGGRNRNGTAAVSEPNGQTRSTSEGTGGKPAASSSPSAGPQASSTAAGAGQPPSPAGRAGQPGEPGGAGSQSPWGRARETMGLMRLMGGIGRLESENKQPLTAAQAKAVLAVVNPLRKASSLSEDQAGKAVTKINSILSADQRKILAEAPSGPRMRREGEGQGQGPRPPGEGQPRRFPSEGMGSSNPLNPPKDSPMAERMQSTLDALEKKAKGK
jgi:hypothetical protein